MRNLVKEIISKGSIDWTFLCPLQITLKDRGDLRGCVVDKGVFIVLGVVGNMDAKLN